jgi:tetratricopeptide (TPR) repeat protein
MSSLKQLVVGTAVIVLGLQTVQADTIWIGDTMKDAIKVDGVKIQDPKGDKLGYLTDQGMITSKAFSKLQEINIDGETTFNSAEQAYAAKDYDTAITAYQTLLESSSKDWMQTRAAMRLIAAGKVKNRYDAQVAAYVALLQKDPATAAQNKPTPPVEHSPYLDTALGSISKGLDNPKLDNTQKSTLLNLELEIQQAKGDDAQATGTLQQLDAMGASTDAMKATLKLASARMAYKSKQYPQAIADIEQNKAIFTDPDQQVDALFVLAEAKFAVDGDKTDPDVLKDLGLNYMRVVTFGSQLADKPHVADSLYQTAMIEEKLKENAAALQLYNQIVNDRAFAALPVKTKAEAAITRLKAAK